MTSSTSPFTRGELEAAITSFKETCMNMDFAELEVVWFDETTPTTKGKRWDRFDNLPVGHHVRVVDCGDECWLLVVRDSDSHHVADIN
jgi:hypothetical protein